MKTGHDIRVVKGVVVIIAKSSDNLVEKTGHLVLSIVVEPICDVLIRSKEDPEMILCEYLLSNICYC